MQEKFKLKRDYYAGGLMLLLGVGAAVIGTGYKFGTLARMGPGFMPVMLGVVLAFIGRPDRRHRAGIIRARRREIPAGQPAMVRLALHPRRPRPVHHPRANMAA